jgi:GT2 family glycosyltransferase
VAPRLSIIIPVYNAAGTLRGCLASIFTNREPSYEVIVVDDASKDESVKIALEFPCRVIALESNIMAANCRNLGAKLASGEIFVFFDSDQLMRLDTLRNFDQLLRADPTADAIVASFQPDTPSSGFFSKFKNLRHHHVHQTATVKGSTLASGLTAIRRASFEGQGGFEPAYQPASIEDIALGYRLARSGGRIRFCGNIQVTHLKSYTLWQLVRSDILDRAIPWVGLMMRDRMWQNNLNTSNTRVFSVAASWSLAMAPMVLGWRWGGFVALVCSGLIAFANFGFLAAALRHFGLGFLAKSVLFMPVMYFYHGVGLLAGLTQYLIGASVVGRSPLTQPRYRELQGQASGKWDTYDTCHLPRTGSEAWEHHEVFTTGGSSSIPQKLDR